MGPLTRLQRWQHWWPRLEPCPTSRSGSSPGPSLSSKNCTLVQPRACIINIVLSCPVILYVFIVKKKALFLYQNKQPLSFLFLVIPSLFGAIIPTLQFASEPPFILVAPKDKHF